MRRRSLTRRSPAEWGFRAALALGVTVLGYTSVHYSLAYATRGSNAERSHALAPWDGRVTAALSERLSGPDASAAERKKSDQVARLALRQDPTAVAAVATLGINAQLRGDNTAARRLFAYSNALSRRDLRTQLWSVEDAVVRGNVKDALRHYDIALRTSRIAPDLMFPVLASAIEDASIRTELTHTLAAKPSWTSSFVDYVAANGPAPRMTAMLLLELHQASVPISQGAQASLINALLSGEHFEAAWEFYQKFRPGADRRFARDGRFTADLDIPTAFDWVPVNEEGYTTSIQRGGEGGVFDFAAPPSVGGPLLRQTQMLPPGDYLVEGHSIAIDQPEDTRPYWVLSCRDGRELGRVVVPSSSEDNGRFSGRLRVPAHCPLQLLSLVARPSTAMGGLSGQIDDLRLRPVR